jgi:hypothetical protein
MNRAAMIIFAKTVEFACLNPQEQPSAFANRVSPGTTATPRCRRVQKNRASMTLIAQKILPVAQATVANAKARIAEVAIVKRIWSAEKMLAKMEAEFTSNQMVAFVNVLFLILA